VLADLDSVGSCGGIVVGNEIDITIDAEAILEDK